MNSNIFMGGGSPSYFKGLCREGGRNYGSHVMYENALLHLCNFLKFSITFPYGEHLFLHWYKLLYLVFLSECLHKVICYFLGSSSCLDMILIKEKANTQVLVCSSPPECRGWEFGVCLRIGKL